MAIEPRRGLGTALLQPQAAPVQSYVQPGPSPLRGLAEGLRAFDSGLDQFVAAREASSEDDKLRGQAAYLNNQQGYADAVREGKIPSFASKGFVDGYKMAEGDVAGTQLQEEFNSAFDAWGGKNSDDPQAYQKWSAEWMAGKIQTTDPSTLKGMMPHLQVIVRGGTQRYIDYKHQRTYQGSLAANTAGGSQDIDKAKVDGTGNPDGPDYTQAWGSVMKRRETFVASGGRGEDFDKSMMGAVVTKALGTNSVSEGKKVLSFFDLKVPGTDYTYGDTPEGSALKQQALDKLEVAERQGVAAASEAQRKADKAAEDNVTRETLDAISQNPTADLPAELVERGRKYIPDFLAKVQTWRGSLNTGITDRDKLNAVYAEVTQGGGTKAVTRAMQAGVFGRAEDLTAAYAFAKGFEDNKDRIEGTLGSTSAKNILTAIQTRTTAKDDLVNPLAGLTNEGLEAQYDFRRAVQNWIVANPDATPEQVEEQVAKIGAFVLGRIQAPDLGGSAGSYERTGNVPWSNPYSPPSAPAAPQPSQVQPQPNSSPAQQQQPAQAPQSGYYQTLPPEQQQAIQQRASRLGITPEEYASRLQKAREAGQTQRPLPQGEGGAKLQPISFSQAEVDQLLDEATGLSLSEDDADKLLTEALSSSYKPGRQRALVDNDPRAGNILDLIGKHESGGNYNAVYGKSASKRDLSKLTLDQILAEQQASRKAGAASTAVGRYQFIYTTLNGLKRELGLSGSEPFTPQLQDKLAYALLERRGWSDFKAGRITQREFARRLSQEWASLPDPTTGRSYYDGDGLNRSGVSTGTVLNTLKI